MYTDIEIYEGVLLLQGINWLKAYNELRSEIEGEHILYIMNYNDCVLHKNNKGYSGYKYTFSLKNGMLSVYQQNGIIHYNNHNYEFYLSDIVNENWFPVETFLEYVVNICGFIIKSGQGINLNRARELYDNDEILVNILG